MEAAAQKPSVKQDNSNLFGHWAVQAWDSPVFQDGTFVVVLENAVEEYLSSCPSDLEAKVVLGEQRTV